MILITLGSQKFQFNRLLRYIDELIEEKYIEEDVFAQVGYSDYNPQNYEYKNFLDRDEFDKLIKNCDTVITHGGSGVIISAVKSRKSVIALPRLKEFGEHVDDHQKQIVNEFEKMKFIKSANSKEELKLALTQKESNMKEYVSNTNSIIRDIDNFINKE